MGEDQNVHEETMASNATGAVPMEKRRFRRNVGKAWAWAKGRFSKEHWKKTTAILLAVVVLAGAVAGTFAHFAPASVAEHFCKVYWLDERTATRMMAYDWNKERISKFNDEEAFFENRSDYYETEIQSWADYYKAVDTRTKEDLTDDYGHFRIKTEATKVRDISIKKVVDDNEDLLDTLERHGNFDRDTIKAAKEITVKVKIVGEDETDRDTWQVTLVRIGMQWKVLSYDG